MSIYTAGGPNSNFEKQSAQLMAGMQAKIQKIESQIVDVMKKALATPSRSSTYWRGVEKQLAGLYAEINSVYATSASASIPASYASSLREIQKYASGTKKIAETASRSAAALARSQGTQQIASALVEDAVAAMESATAAGYRNVRRITRLTQQAIVDEWIIDSAVAEAYASGEGINSFYATLSARSPEWAAMVDAFGDGGVVQAGSRKFSASYYAEMVSRTKFHEAQAHAAIQQAQNYNTDLVVVSNHNTRTEICQPYEARTFSISGKDNRFPVLDQSPPFHPNCLHLIYPVFESAMMVDGTLAGQSDFSLGKTDRPPVPKGYEPIAERG